MIKKLKWNNSKILGNLELVFTKEDKTPYKTVVFAGDNGTGKTTILNDLATFLKGGTFEPFSFIDYEATGVDIHIEPFSDGNSKYGNHKRIVASESGVTNVFTNPNNDPPNRPDEKDLRYYGFAYSNARVGFKTEPIKKVSASQINDKKYNNDNDDRDFTTTKQLLVDVSAQDDREFSKIGKSKGFADYKAFKPNSKLFRFEKAFNDFFDGMQFEGVEDTENAEMEVFFKKHGKTIGLDNLSAGEKQIIFRGTYLLRNSQAIEGGIVLVDEPELSMHPKWQQKILSFYQKLFSNERGQFSQLFVATHSEHVIKSALEDPDALVIVLKNEKGNVEPKNIVAPYRLSCITNAEVTYLAFGVYTNDYHNQLYCRYQEKTGTKASIEKCDRKIESTNPPYNPSIHYKFSKYKSHEYHTLPTYIRNAIDHYDGGASINERELEISTELLVELCK